MIIVVVHCLQEYEHGTSPEAVVVKDLDKFDMIFQAFEYEQGISFLNGVYDNMKALFYSIPRYVVDG